MFGVGMNYAEAPTVSGVGNLVGHSWWGIPGGAFLVGHSGDSILIYSIEHFVPMQQVYCPRIMAHGNMHIGTSGWSYDHWRGAFYPETLPAGRWLEFYARQFNSVGINSSFYRLPKEKTLQNWCDGVPDGFVFTVKANRFITHMKKLKDARHTMSPFLQRISVLGERLGPVLLQLLPRWHFNEHRLASFLASLRTDFRYAFEFRDPSWMNEQTCAQLAQHGAAFCIYELDGFTSPGEVTTDFI